MKRKNERSGFCGNYAGRSVDGSTGSSGTDGSGQGTTKTEPAHEKGTKTKTAGKAGKLAYCTERKKKKTKQKKKRMMRKRWSRSRRRVHLNKMSFILIEMVYSVFSIPLMFLFPHTVIYHSKPPSPSVTSNWKTWRSARSTREEVNINIPILITSDP